MTSIYNTGTVTVTNGSAVVTGSGTAWAVALVTGGMFTRLGIAIPILSVDSDTQITLVYAWPGTTAAGAAYAIDRENSDAANIVDLYDKLSRVLVTLSLAGITPESSGTLTDRAALTLAMGDKGYLFLHAEIGVAFAFYRWNGTAWDGPFAVANAVATGGVSSLVAGAGVTVDNTNPAIPVVSATPHAATSKATPVDADEMSLFDSAASFGLKKLTWANAKAGVLAYFNGTAKATPIDADRVWVGDSTASNVPKYTTLTQFKAYLKTYFDTLYNSTSLARREVLTAARTYYVRTDGSDSNGGLANTSVGAFLTVQKAIDVVASLDISIYNVTIQVADGTYTGSGIVGGPWVGSGTVTITGNATTPANVILQTTASASGVIQATNGGRITVSNLKVTASGAVGLGIYATGGGSAITYSNIDFGAVTNYHINAASSGASIVSSGTACTISGGAQFHALVAAGGYIRCVIATITLTGTPAFSVGFVSTGRGGGLIEYYSNTFVGSATGKRYAVGALGQIFSNGGGASYYPGSVAGTTDALGVYG